MEFYEELEKQEIVTSHIDKLEMLKEFIQKFDNAEKFLRTTFNNDIYGIQEKTIYNAFDLEPGKEIKHVSDFLFVRNIPNYKFLDDEELYKGINGIKKLSGKVLLNKIRDFFHNLPSLQAKWWSRLLLHDLRCGIQVKTVNKAFKDLGLKQIEKFSLQLAKKVDLYDPKDVAKRIKFPCSMETKYDGIRIQANVWSDDDEMFCVLMSRRGTDRTESYPEIVTELKERFCGQNVILDGEVVAASFQQLTRKDDTSRRRYVIFDILNDELLPAKDRWCNLKSLLSSVGITETLYKINNNIKQNNNSSASRILLITEHYDCNNIEDLKAFYEEINERQEEGIMIKDDNAIYKRGSRTNMCKAKKVYTADLKIIGFDFGDGKRTGKVSTLKLIDKSETLRVDVGSGIDDYTCDLLTDQVDDTMNGGGHESSIPFIGAICEIKYNEGSINSDGEKSIRFPRFICIRDDKIEPDDVSDIIFR